MLSVERGTGKLGGLYPGTSGLGTSGGSVAAVFFRCLMGKPGWARTGAIESPSPEGVVALLIAGPSLA